MLLQPVKILVLLKADKNDTKHDTSLFQRAKKRENMAKHYKVIQLLLERRYITAIQILIKS